MKVLRLYNHYGVKQKEFNVYVEGQDFKWEASYPEAVWFGSITLEEVGKEPEAMPTPEPEVVEPELMTYKEGLQKALETTTIQDSYDRAKKVEEVKDESETVLKKSKRRKGTNSSDSA